MTLDSPLPETFRIYPQEGAADYFIVYVGEDDADMHRAMARVDTPRIESVVAACISMSVTEPYADLVGMLFFSRATLCASIVAHEMAHAGFRFAERCCVRIEHWDRECEPGDPSVEMTNKNEEEYADVVERLTGQFWKEAYARNVA